jgi:flagellin-like hook-associated protein FlgL
MRADVPDSNRADTLTMKKKLSHLEDVDLTERAMQLRTQPVEYHAAVQVTAKAIRPSLADLSR